MLHEEYSGRCITSHQEELPGGFRAEAYSPYGHQQFSGGTSVHTNHRETQQVGVNWFGLSA